MLVEEKFRVYGKIGQGSEAVTACNLLMKSGRAVTLNETTHEIYQNYFEAKASMESVNCAVFNEKGAYIGSLAHLIDYLD